MPEPKEIAGKTYTESDEIKAIAEAVIKSHNINLMSARVRYVSVAPKISKTLAAQCRKAGVFAEFFGDCDYIITVSEETWKLIDQKVREILMLHELMHVNPKMKKNGEIKHCVRDHNVKDFRNIIEEHGIDWLTTLYQAMLKTLDEKEKLDLDDIKL